MDTVKNILKLVQESFPPIHKEGHPFIFVFGAVSVLLWAIYEPLGAVGFIVTAWCVYFFRDPVRVIPENKNLIVSPADGLVQMIEKALPPEELGLEDKELTRVSIFLNIFDVHINRVPIDGKVADLNYRPGKFLSANLDKASSENERQTLVIETEDNKRIICVQIAGLVARRIVCDLEEKQEVQRGDRYGLIRFGSRVDMYLPEGVNPTVMVGQRAIGGETIIADVKSKSAARKGVAK